MIVVELDGSTLARTRVATSPLADAVSWLRLCVSGRSDRVLGSPGAAARASLAHPDVALLAALVPRGGRGYVPDFVTPQPVEDDEPLAHQLADVAGTGAAEVRRQVEDERFAGAPVPRAVRQALDDDTLARRVAHGLAVFWREAVAEAWQELQPVLEADVARRSITAGRDGVGAMLASLDPRIRFRGVTLEVDLDAWDERRTFVDADLVVCPLLFAWPAVSSQLCRPDQAVLGYPAAGIGSRRPTRSPASLGALLGETRGALLGDLGLPRSTQELGERHGLSAATVSYHLQILHDNGLLLRTRDRHRVLYQRTHRAELLLGPDQARAG